MLWYNIGHANPFKSTKQFRCFSYAHFFIPKFIAVLLIKLDFVFERMQIVAIDLCLSSECKMAFLLELLESMIMWRYKIKLISTDLKSNKMKKKTDLIG